MFMRVFNSIANSAEQLHRHVESDVFWRNTEPVSIQFKDGLSLCNNSSVSIKFVSDFRQVGGFFWVLCFPSPIKLTPMI
jgi:hypothetical protein